MKLLFLLLLMAGNCFSQNVRVMVFSKTKGYRHESIAAGKIALQRLGKELAWAVDTTENSAAFTVENLSRYRVVVFLNTSGDVLDGDQEVAFQSFVRKGGGFVGIHSATTTEYDWPWFGQLVGGYFTNHPKPQKATLHRTSEFAKLPATWDRFDEWYNFRNLSPAIKVIYNLDESSYQGGELGREHPLVWYHQFEGGRSFYMGVGHTIESYSDLMFLDVLKEGFLFTAGVNN